jgi:hypothetical protein
LQNKSAFLSAPTSSFGLTSMIFWFSRSFVDLC